MRQKTVLKKANLVAHSPHNAFYLLTLEKITDGYIVRKESGVNGVVLNREAWYRENIGDAEKAFSSDPEGKNQSEQEKPSEICCRAL